MHMPFHKCVGNNIYLDVMEFEKLLRLAKSQNYI